MSTDAPDTTAVTIVSGLPRSGTSMMMRMLEAGGLEVLSDGIRSADEDNPRGYFELEAVKRTTDDDAWLARARGKVVKVISQLLFDLPEQPDVRVIFMRRDLDEVLASQKRMLERRGEPSDQSDEEMKGIFVDHLAQVEQWLRETPWVSTRFVSYNRMVDDPRKGAERVNEFLGDRLDVEAMIAAVEPSLYRNRKKAE